MQRQTCNYFRLDGRRQEEPTGNYVGCKARLRSAAFCREEKLLRSDRWIVHLQNIYSKSPIIRELQQIVFPSLNI
ncbi:hypothetical protein [Nostoc sp.]|uniref:hypothetical protein n=1 Tax=Nostoc sp. TaxID=1180 RepID=UPI002FFA251C